MKTHFLFATALLTTGLFGGPWSGPSLFGPGWRGVGSVDSRWVDGLAAGVVGSVTPQVLADTRVADAVAKSAVRMHRENPYPGVPIHEGATGSFVLAIQQRLKALGVTTGPLDSNFGPITLHAVRQFQFRRGLAVDGIVGPQTWAALFPQSHSMLLTRIHQYLQTRQSNVAVAVYNANTQQTYVYNPLQTFDTASIVKTLILATLLHQRTADREGLPRWEQGLAEPMIEESDNEDATHLWEMAGEASGIGQFAAMVGMRHTVPNAAGYWGLTITTPLDEVKLLRDFAFPNRLLNPAARQYVLDLMDQVVSWQRWGISAGVAPSAMVAIKNGWLPLGPGNWEINSTGYVRGDGRNYVIAALTSGNPSESYGIATVQAVSRLVWRAMR